jgi:predicted nucleic acid-binding protein
VLQEFFVTVTRKVPKPLEAPAATECGARQKENSGAARSWHSHDVHQRIGASFWDAMILRSAKELHCQVLHSEDLNPGQENDGIRLRSPFPGLVTGAPAGHGPVHHRLQFSISARRAVVLPA